MTDIVYGERDRHNLLEDMRPDVRTEPFGGNHLDFTLQNILKEERFVHKIVKGMLFRRKLHKEIEIAAGALLTSNERAEEADTPAGRETADHK